VRLHTRRKLQRYLEEHAQGKPPVYQVVEIDMSDQEAYLKDYVPKAQAAIKAAGGKFLAVTSNGKSFAYLGDLTHHPILLLFGK
jgi:uncharacterized protein (DUF1330 family)